MPKVRKDGGSTNDGAPVQVDADDYVTWRQLMAAAKQLGLPLSTQGSSAVEGPIFEPVEAAPGLTGTYGRFFMPEAYGAPAVYSALVDDTAAVQAAITAAQTARGVVRLNRLYSVPSGGLTITSPVAVVGVGGVIKGGTSPASGFTSDHATAVGLTVQASGVVLRDFAIVNTHATAPTAGAGLLCDTSGSFTWGDLNIYDHVDVVGWFDNAYIKAGSYWRMFGSYNYDAAQNGIRISNANNVDGGDQYITNNTITTTRVATGGAIKWESGGGPKIVGNKINGTAPNGFNYGVWMSPQTALTSVMIVNANSIENTRTNSVRLGTSGNAFSKMIVTDNQCSMYQPTGTPESVIYLDGNNALAEVIVSNNVIYGAPAIKYGIYVDGFGLARIGPNVVNGTPGGIHLGPLNTGIDVTPPTMAGTVTLVRDDIARSSSANVGVALIDHRYARQVPATGKVTPSALYAVGLTQNDNVLLEIVVNGAVSGVGDYFILAQRQVTRPTTGDCVVATVGTDVTVGAAVADVTLAFDVSTVSGEARATVVLAGGSAGTNIYGRCSMKVLGGPFTVKRGAATTP